MTAGGGAVVVATELFNSAANAPLPSADITEGEVNILKDQHLTKGVIDEILNEAKAKNADRETRLATLEKEIEGLQQEVNGWEEKEKARVKVELEESCKEQKK